MNTPRRILSRIVCLTAVGAAFLAAPSALAQDAASAGSPTLAAVPPPPLPPYPPAPPAAVAPVAPAPPVEIAAPTSSHSEEPLTVEGGYTCTVGEHGDVPEPDARTTADVVCHSLATHGAQPGAYDIRLGRLGGKLLLVISQKSNGDERRIFIGSLDEVPVAGDRLVEALVQHKTVEQTQRVDNVVSSEAGTPMEKKVQPGVYLGLTGLASTGGGIPSSISAGIEIDMNFRLRELEFVMHGRAGGIGSADDKMGYATAGAGVRYYLSDSDFAPFVGGGLLFGYYQANLGQQPDMNGSGAGGYAEVGLEFLRASHVSGLFSLRADLPMFDLKTDTNDYSGPVTNAYVVPLSFNAGLFLH